MRLIHRRLAWIAGLVAVLWAATGFLHPIMSWTAPRPAAMAPPHAALSVEDVAAPGPILERLRWREARAVRLIAINGAQYWLAFDDAGRSVAFNAQTGAINNNAERDHAIALARHYAGRPNETIASTQRLAEFDLFYPSINRVLPVWDVRYNDGLSVYVDTRADRFVTQADPLRRALLLAFQNIHTLTFLSSIESLRKALIFVLIAMTLASAAFGFVMALTAKGKRVRLAHRVIGLVAAPLLFCFGLSGLFHALAPEPPEAPAPLTFSVANLAAPRIVGGVQSISATADLQGQAIWRAGNASQGFYMGPDGALSVLDDPSRARMLAGAASTAPTQFITTFTDEYGFANKRLPVWRVAGNGPTRFVDVNEGIVAAIAPDGIASFEAWSFSALHKWQGLNPIGKLKRDILMMLAAALIAATAMLGFKLNFKPRPRQTQEKAQ